ncbi:MULTISPECIES: hypothetical protein [unclassified Mesorhizobium]|uniref:hypothetical protein n=1 Tax=unclassified Mesorhizobium TaxID=325217 RepID=UPI001ABF6963|nr:MULTISPECIES: hypothetical protein [unclassified Mesorhizobium]
MRTSSVDRRAVAINCQGAKKQQPETGRGLRPGITTSLKAADWKALAGHDGKPPGFEPAFTLHRRPYFRGAKSRAVTFANHGRSEKVGRARQPAGASLCCPSAPSRRSAPKAEPAADYAPTQNVRASLPCPEGHVTPQRSVYFLAGAFAFAGAAFAFGAAAFFTAGLVAAAAAFMAGFAAAFAAGFAAALAGAAFLAAGFAAAFAAGFAAALAAGFFAGAAFAAGFAAALAGAAFFTAGFAAALAGAGFLAGAAFAAGFAAAFAGAAFFTAVAAFAATAFAGAFFAGVLDAGALDDCLAMSCPFTLCRWP